MTELRCVAIANAAAAMLALITPLMSSRAEGTADRAPAAIVASPSADAAPRSTGRVVPGAAESPRPRDNDYPTSERADYVIGCMAANGNTREALLKCSCAIDTIAGLMPYSNYEQAETALSLQLGGGVGGRVGLFRDPPQIKAVNEELRRAQAEANLQCR
jgi:hypothetical protein